jgi:hypothetical protein
MRFLKAVAFLCALTGSAVAAGYPAPKQGDWIARDFKFHTGDVMPELRLHYTTIGEPTGQPVLILHGTAGSGAGMLTPAFAAELFGPGQPLDAKKYFIILPDAIGAGKSSKPSDGMRAKFPEYNYDDMVAAAALLAINAADDERNPPETGIMERELKRVKNGKLLLIPASEDTRGHGTTGNAKFYAKPLAEWLAGVPQKGM